MSHPEPLSFADFQAFMAKILEVDPARVKPEAYLITDLGVDSIRMVEVLLRLDEMGIAVSPDLAWKIQTVGDAYAYYQEQMRAKKP